MSTATKLARMTPEDELVLRLIDMKPRQQSDFPRLWEEQSNPDRVACERAMKASGRSVPGRFNGWGGQVRLAQRKLIIVKEFDNGRGKDVPMYTTTEAGKTWITTVDSAKKRTGAAGAAAGG